MNSHNFLPNHCNYIQPSSVNNITNEKKYFCNYQSLLIDSLINKKKTHFTSIYKENLLSYAPKNYLKQFFPLQESLDKIPILGKYYKHYLQFLSRPKISSLPIRCILRKNNLQKALYYLSLKYGAKDENAKKNEYDFCIKENIENCSTTITCDSKEQLVYPMEIFKQCTSNFKNLINEEKTFSILGEEFGGNEIDNGNKSGFFANEQDKMSMKNLMYFLTVGKNKKIDIKAKLQKFINEKETSNYQINHKKSFPILEHKKLQNRYSTCLKGRFLPKVPGNSKPNPLGTKQSTSVRILTKFSNEPKKNKISLISSIQSSKKMNFIISQKKDNPNSKQKIKKINPITHKAKCYSDNLDNYCNGNFINSKSMLKKNIIVKDLAKYIQPHK